MIDIGLKPIQFFKLTFTEQIVIDIAKQFENLIVKKINSKIH